MIMKIVSLVTVSFLWGATNPLLRSGTKGIEDINADTKLKQFLYEIKFLVTRWQYIIPFLLNQLGSVLYFFLLQNTELSLAVPVANSLSFIFTWMVGSLLGEQKANWRTICGMALVIIGTTICMYDKMETKK